MTRDKLTAGEKLQGDFNRAAYKFGFLIAKDILDEKKLDALFSDVAAIDRVLDAQQVLHYLPDGTHDKLADSLALPVEKLKAGFVRKVDAAIRKLDPEKLDARTRRALEI